MYQYHTLLLKRDIRPIGFSHFLFRDRPSSSDELTGIFSCCSFGFTADYICTLHAFSNLPYMIYISFSAVSIFKLSVVAHCRSERLREGEKGSRLFLFLNPAGLFTLPA